MNICHVNLASPSSITNHIGSEKHIFQLIKHQAHEGYELTVIVHPDNESILALRELGCNVILTTHFSKSHSKKITKNGTLIHVHEEQALYWALIQNILHGTPYIVTRRIDTPLKNKWLSNLAYRKASALVGLNSEIVKQLEALNCNEKIFKIPNSPISYPVDQNKVDQLSNEFRGKFIVFHAANMLENKGFDTTVKAAKLLGVKNPRVQFLLLGDGPEREALEQQCRGLTNIRFMEEQNDIGSILAAADLLIHPSLEGIDSVILEAMAAGLPVIGCNAAGISDIIDHGVSGLLCEAGNAKQLAAQIDRLENDDALRHSLKTSGKEKLTQFDIVYTSKRYQDIYTKVESQSI